MCPWAVQIRTGQRQPLRVVVVLADSDDEAKTEARKELKLGEWIEDCLRVDWVP